LKAAGEDALSVRLGKSGIAFIAFALGLGCGTLAMLALGPDMGRLHAVPPHHPLWIEVAWPFPMDQWGKGKAFRCSAEDCGAEVNLYVRAKIGFCNCTTGVADDDELDPISDYALVNTEWSPLAPGAPIKVAWMLGRSRMFAIRTPSAKSAISIGLNDNCDAIVGTATIGHNAPTLLAGHIAAFLNSKPVLHWAQVTLGL
jgi:hypothetical protein